MLRDISARNHFLVMFLNYPEPQGVSQGHAGAAGGRLESELYRAFFICRIRGFLGSEDPDSAQIVTLIGSTPFQVELPLNLILHRTIL